jgi:hypothetical protein
MFQVVLNMQSDDSWHNVISEPEHSLPQSSKTPPPEMPPTKQGENETNQFVGKENVNSVTEANSPQVEPPVPGEEPTSSSYENAPRHKFEIPFQLLAEAKNDPLAAFNKLMAARDKEKGIDPERFRFVSLFVSLFV